MDFRADLHVHTTCSDGTDSPSQVLNLAKQAGLQGLSFTDHDTIDAYTEEIFAEAKLLEIELLHGVEISSEHKGNPVHILGYGFDLQSPVMIALLEEIQNLREIRNRGILRKLSEIGYVITEQELKEFATDRTIGRPHIAQLMVQKGYVPTFASAFNLYLKDSGSCYVHGIRLSPPYVIEKIHQSKGKAIIAHPHFIRKTPLITDLLQMPFDGVEAYYALLSPVEEMRWIDIAEKKGWIATGGSDYHGEIKPQKVGCSWVNEETFKKLQR